MWVRHTARTHISPVSSPSKLLSSISVGCKGVLGCLQANNQALHFFFSCPLFLSDYPISSSASSTCSSRMAQRRLLRLQVAHRRLPLSRLKALPLSSVSHSRQAKCFLCQAIPSARWNSSEKMIYGTNTAPLISAIPPGRAAPAAGRRHGGLEEEQGQAADTAWHPERPGPAAHRQSSAARLPGPYLVAAGAARPQALAVVTPAPGGPALPEVDEVDEGLGAAAADEAGRVPQPCVAGALCVHHRAVLRHRLLAGLAALQQRA